MIRPIAISLAPNTEIEDIALAFKTLFYPWKWFSGNDIRKVEAWFKNYLKKRYVFCFDSGRSGELAILKSMGIGEDDEVLIQAFTCVAVPNSVIWAGAKPVYVDIEEKTFNIDPIDLERKITKKTKAIIVQHTFGITANMDEIQKIAKKHKLFLIEDCAHSLGASYLPAGRQDKGGKVGSFGDAAFFSFGRDKVISSVFGGVVVTGNKRLAERLLGFQRTLSFPSYFWIFQQLLHPISFAVILPLYHVFGIGKFLLYLFQKIYLLSVPVDRIEKVGKRPSFYPRRLPNAQAILAYQQLKKLERFNNHRKAIVQYYREELGKGDYPFEYPKTKEADFLLRFPVLTISGVRKKHLLEFFKKKKIILGNWYSNVIDPLDVDLQSIGYNKGMCPVAEQTSRTVINLPTYPTLSLPEAGKIIDLLKKWGK